MQNQKSNQLQLTIITPNDPPITIFCDSVHLPITDGKNGKGSGSYGIRHNHAKAIFSLDNGKIEVYQNGNLSESFICSQGFAKTENSILTVTTESIKKI